MHLRPKPWARPELEACGFFIPSPWDQKGNWRAVFPKQQPFHLELGCGKGQFIAQLASSHPEINYLALDMIDTVLGLTQRNVKAAYNGQPVDNLRLSAWDISRIDSIMDEGDRVERIYINFCNPWPRHRHHKKRLTHTRQLEHYLHFLEPGGQIHFKTDDDPLFADSLKYFESCGFILDPIIEDLHAQNLPSNIVTEHEAMFAKQGIKIKYVIATRPMQ